MDYRNKKSGFTLIELLVVIAIIGLLSSAIFASLSSARDKSKIAKVQSDLRQLQLAIELLFDDTGLHPSKINMTPCIQNPEVYVDLPAAGIQASDGGFPGWGGPYMSKVPLDPWGTNYYFDPDYQCGLTTLGCGNSTQMARVVQSFGPNKTQNYGDGDDIVLVLCR